MRHAIALLALSMASPAYAENCKTNVTGFTYCDNGRMFKESSNGLILEYGTGNMWKKDGYGNTYGTYGNRPDATLPPALITPPYQIEDNDK
jgi:hypothetical protein